MRSQRMSGAPRWTLLRARALLPGRVELEHGGGEELLVFGEDEGFVGADDDNEVVAGGEVVLVEAEGFAEAALDAVSPDGGADLAGDGEAEARVREGVGDGVEGEGAAG